VKKQPSHRRAAGMTALAATFALTAAACGSSGGGQSSDSTTGAGGQPISIALVYPTSGVWTTQGTNSVNGAKLAINDVNASGGVLGGRKLVAQSADAGNDPQSAASAAKRLIQNSKPSALVGAYLSSYTLTVSTVAEQAKIADITQSFSDELVTRGYKYTFKTTPTAAAFSNGAFDYLSGMYKAAGKPLPKVAILASDDASGQQQYKAAAAAAPKAGFDVVLSEQYPANITDTTSLVNRIKSAAPDLLLLNGPDLAEIQIIKSLRAQAYTAPIVGLGGAGVMTQNFADALGKDADGTLATVAWNGDLSDKAKTVEQAYVKQYGGTFMPGEAGTAYVGVWLAALAIDKAGSSEPQKVAAALRTLDATDGPAAIFPGGKIAFDERGLNSKSFPLMVQYQGGKPVTVWPQDSSKATPKL